MAEKVARAVMADYDLERVKWHIAEYEKRKKGGKADGIGWLVEGIKADYRPQVSIFEREEEAKRKAAQEERARKAALDAEIERIKEACDEHNRKAGLALLDRLDAEERQRLDGEFLARFGDVPLLGKRFRQDGHKSPLVLSLYLIFLREKRPEAAMSYLEYAKAHKASKEAVKALKNG